MKKIMFCGGGSAGHVIPNIAIIESLNENFQSVYLGTNGIEKNICKNNGVKFYTFEAAKLVRGKIFCNLLLPFKLIKSVKQAGEILDEVKPDLIFCKGGYVCLPPSIAAKKRNIPVITHESDLSAGLANRIISKKCDKVLTSFKVTATKFKKGIFTGTPMRANLFNRNKLAALKKYNLDMRPTVLVLGGGSGSVKINRVLRNIIPKLCKDYNVLHLCGKGNLVDSNVYGYRQIEFTDDMGLVYACADIAVSRCGSNTANELIALKIPTLFIPLENRRSRGDQILNAEYFSDEGLCKVLREPELTEESLIKNIYELFSDKKIKSALLKSKITNGTDRIIEEIVFELNSRKI